MADGYYAVEPDVPAQYQYGMGGVPEQQYNVPVTAAAPQQNAGPQYYISSQQQVSGPPASDIPVVQAPLVIRRYADSAYVGYVYRRRFYGYISAGLLLIITGIVLNLLLYYLSQGYFWYFLFLWSPLVLGVIFLTRGIVGLIMLVAMRKNSKYWDAVSYIP